MSWSFKIARLADIEVRIHLTFVLFLAWIGGSYYFTGGMPAAIEGVSFMLVQSLRRPTEITAWRAQRPGLPA